MAKKIKFILFFLILTVNYAYLASPAQPEEISSLEPLRNDDRILILAPHPDDEALGCAGIIQEAVKAGARIRIVYLTNGDHNQIAFIVYEKRLTLRKNEFIHMGEVRRKEAIKAMQLLGLVEGDLVFLGYPDFGTFSIFRAYWQDSKPYRSLLTRISAVPYKNNFSIGSPYKGESILADLEKIILDYKPTKIFVSHPADTNVDHKAFYLFLHIALRDLEKQIARPKVYPYLVHCVGWPLPRHYHPELGLQPPRKFLDSQINWLNFELTPQQLKKKYQAILCYRSQTESSAFYLLSFARKNELFGDYPEIELKRPGSLEDRPVSFFGLSNIFTDSTANMADDLDKIIGDKSQVSYGLSEESLLIRIDKAKELNRKFGIIFYVFGYSHKTPFAQMPKIRLVTRHNTFRVFDGRKIIETGGITLESSAGSVLLKIPFRLLGEPDFILTSLKTYSKILPADAISFRKITIK